MIDFELTKEQQQVQAVARSFARDHVIPVAAQHDRDESYPGDVIRAEGSPHNGMVMDFSQVKALAKAHLVDAWDHAFLVWRGDTALLSFLESLPGHKTVVLEVVPTAENLAAVAFDLLDRVYRNTYGNHLRLEQIRLYETPNCWADAVRKEVGQG